MDKVFVAQGVARKVMASEASIDVAIADASALLSGLIEARQELKIAAFTGDETIAKVAEAITALTAARSAVVASHHQLAEVKLRIGVRTTLFGNQDCPSKQASFEDTVRAVSEVA